jgi:hypothetical protein
MYELTDDQVALVAGASKLGENVLLFGGAGAAVGGIIGNGPGAAAGALVGAAVGALVTLFD